jgi:mono/diheme cytochrome c family protein
MRAIAWALALAWLSPGTVLAAEAGTDQILKVCKKTDAEDCIVREFKHTVEAAQIRGRSVYRAYCVLCHGENGLGDGRAAKVHTPRPANLVESRVPPEYIELIVRKGGAGVGRYAGMPPWSDQLTDEQISDVKQFLIALRKP